MALTKVQNTGIADDAVTTDKIENTTVVAADIAAGTVSADKLASTLDLSSKTVTLKNNEISNTELANSSITINGSAISLGGSGTAKHIDWQAVTVADGSTLLQAEAGKGYFLDTNAGVIEIRLPTSPSRGDTIVFADYAGHFDLNQIIINTAGKNIDSTATGDVKVTTKNAVVELVYVDSNKGYLVKMNQTAGTTPGTVMQTLGSSGLYDSDASFLEATGGTVTTSGDFKIHKFTGDGNFVVSSAGNAAGNNKVDYLVVAGGGGVTDSNSGPASGAGGGGGYRESHADAVSGEYTASPLATPTSITVTAQTYPIAVGGGGSSPRSPGSVSSALGITSAGGGEGGVSSAGGAGGSGGGGAGGTPSGGAAGNTPPVSPPQGQNGGSGDPSPPNSAGGGGGAGGTGGTGTSGTAGGSGLATPSEISGAAVNYAAGGTGRGHGPTNSGPTRTGATPIGTAGTANEGDGAPGGSSNTGGKGIVILRYKFQ